MPPGAMTVHGKTDGMSRRRARGRPIDGILPLDKPRGMSSNEALQAAKRLLNARKAGHTGSLDPLATGVLPICLGEATKLSSYLLESDKTYEFDCRLGWSTSTGDSEGSVLREAPVPALEPESVNAVLRKFVGEIDQVPPMHSAVKHQGKRLYRLAREGIEVEREPRRVRISDLELLEIGDECLSLRVTCSKGTYVRVLAADIAAALDTEGHVSALRRTRAGPFGVEDLVTLDRLQAAMEAGEPAESLLQPVDAALGDWPAVELTSDTAWYFRQGQAVLVPQAPLEGRVRVYREEGAFLGLGEMLDDGRVAPRRLLRLAG